MDQSGGVRVVWQQGSGDGADADPAANDEPSASPSPVNHRADIVNAGGVSVLLSALCTPGCLQDTGQGRGDRVVAVTALGELVWHTRALSVRRCGAVGAPVQSHHNKAVPSPTHCLQPHTQMACHCSDTASHRVCGC